MKHKNKKYNLHKIIFHPIFIGLIGFSILTYITIPIIRNAQKQKRINNEIKELENEITRLDGNNSDLKKMINYLNSDQYVLEQARLNLNYKKEQEEMAVIKDVNNGEKTNVGNMQIFDINKRIEEKSLFKDTNIYKWWLYFAKI